MTTKEGFLRALETSAVADRRCGKHEAVRHALMPELLWAVAHPGGLGRCRYEDRPRRPRAVTP
ncbi:hypothetical protein AB0903_20320 [Streptomyces sp. NPDC048389]|uniref:hypothetical protein n=1 Tax=Streptomyces sp. NPDC048389 TaxID=3154622 RepID=UPI003454C7A4